MDFLGACLSSLYYLVCFHLVVFGVYRMWLLLSYGRGAIQTREMPPAPHEWPVVTVQLPLFNERYVARRLIEAVARLDYPLQRLQIQILDDSTDDTLETTRQLASELRECGLDVEHRHRTSRAGYKAGALAAGLGTARGELIAIFDADFVPPADFLRRIVPFVLQPGVGVAQARWEHLNREHSWFTRMQAILLDGHFVIEQAARSWNGYFLSFNGTCGVWRRVAIEAAGGWTSDTVTEDLDLSFRAQLAGWRVHYVADLAVPGELPVEPNAFRSQQRRWTKGGVQVARKLLPRILAAPLPWRIKIEALLHLTCYAAYPLLLLLALLRTPARLLAPDTTLLGLLPGEVELLLVGTFPLLLFYILAQYGAGGRRHWRAWVTRSLPAMALGAGLAVSNTRAVFEGLFSRDLTFHRTPKEGGGTIAANARQRGDGLSPRAYHVPSGWVPIFEVLLVAYIVLWKIFGTGVSVVADLPFVVFFGYGLLAMGLPSLWAAGARSRQASPLQSTALM